MEKHQAVIPHWRKNWEHLLLVDEWATNEVYLCMEILMCIGENHDPMILDVVKDIKFSNLTLINVRENDIQSI
jgi:hypothetical protein